MADGLRRSYSLFATQCSRLGKDALQTSRRRDARFATPLRCASSQQGSPKEWTEQPVDDLVIAGFLDYDVYKAKSDRQGSHAPAPLPLKDTYTEAELFEDDKPPESRRRPVAVANVQLMNSDVLSAKQLEMRKIFHRWEPQTGQMVSLGLQVPRTGRKGRTVVPLFSSRCLYEMSRISEALDYSLRHGKWNEALLNGLSAERDVDQIGFLVTEQLGAGRVETAAESRAFVKAWYGLDQEKKEKYWPYVMIAHLRHRHNQATHFIHRSILDTPPGYLVIMALEIVWKRALLDKNKWRTAQRVIRCVQRYLETYIVAPRISQWFLHSLCIHASSEQRVLLYQLCETHNVRMTALTRLHFVSHISASATVPTELDLCLDTLVKIRQSGIEDESLLLAPAKSLINAACGRQVRWKSFSEILQVYSLVGIDLGIEVSRLQILESLRQNDLEAGWQQFQTLVKAQEDPGLEVYSGILAALSDTSEKDSARGEHLAGFQKRARHVLEPAKKAALKERNPVVLTACLKAITRLLHYDFYVALQLYEQMWDVEPLKKLGLVEAGREPVRLDNPLQPDSVTLGLMTWSFLAYGRPAAEIQKVYDNLVRYRNERDPCLLALAANEMVWNAILKAFFDQNKEFDQWGQFLQQMTSPVYHSTAETIPEQAPDEHQRYGHLRKATNPETQRGYTPPSPTKHTWSILMHGLASRGRFAAADDVVQLMARYAGDVDAAAWNSILSPVSAAQNVSGVMAILGRMQAAGVAADASIDRAIGKFRDKALLQQSLETRLQEQEATSMYAERSETELFEDVDERDGAPKTNKAGDLHESVAVEKGQDEAAGAPVSPQHA